MYGRSFASSNVGVRSVPTTLSSSSWALYIASGLDNNPTIVLFSAWLVVSLPASIILPLIRLSAAKLSSILRSIDCAQLINSVLRIIGLHKTLAPAVSGRTIFDRFFHSLKEGSIYCFVLLLHFSSFLSPWADQIKKREVGQQRKSVDNKRAGASEIRKSCGNLVYVAKVFAVPFDVSLLCV